MGRAPVTRNLDAETTKACRSSPDLRTEGCTVASSSGLTAVERGPTSANRPPNGEILDLGKARLIKGDIVDVLSSLPNQSFDLAIADPPYGVYSKHPWKLPEGHGLPGFGGEWKIASHAWDRVSALAGFDWTLSWLAELRRLVKPTGSIWLHGTYHNIGLLNIGCQLLDLEIINDVVWLKRNAFPNLSCRRLTASHESMLWVHTGGKARKYRFNYDRVKSASFNGDSLKSAGTQLRTVWDIPNNKTREEIERGGHPTQKPLRLLERMIMVSGTPGGRVLVPFLGSGSAAVAAIRQSMAPVGIENDGTYFEKARAWVASCYDTHQARLNVE